MKGLIVIVLLSLSIFSCTNYESKEYIEEEDKAISDLISVLTDAGNMADFNHSLDSIPIIYVIDTLFNDFIAKNNFYNVLDPTLAFAWPLDYKKIKSRKSNITVNSQIINFKVLNKEKFALISEIGFSKYFSTTNEIEIGFFECSRVLFNRRMNKGFLFFNFYCGMLCGWGGLIKIEKINGVWERVQIIESWMS